MTPKFLNIPLNPVNSTRHEAAAGMAELAGAADVFSLHHWA